MGRVTKVTKKSMTMARTATAVTNRILALSDEIAKLKEEIAEHYRNEQQFAREKARRTDQYKALLQVANLLLAVASNEIIDLD